ncbi:TetM/TetW/TetO/TetS family tetracycline resistance ribosomal protection protein [Streptomyces sp. TRM66268-LWL]|uniref:TetM/TetW/TetO/TetS family tetracycline resistance ribosomal protection protein n=1 Tax=Streptomyces polyasparticus TaxID=2767826 RepID=A0ABR7SCA4_9ACTN|nr:TetM/TetW/TetO/TetS family tetracycline resistance ribosomal protection protein [Streptomyces polyasparticus]MBC9712804.1 TetM/TetW/TetO/TetS family tetracycline resistance ribosomal protection protein [Streptomyces polyasparticus]
MSSPTRSLNLGILAHVDAGKTSLTERLLHAAGVIDAPGSVDEGNTRTDSLALERRRGITIKSAVVSFPLGPPEDLVTVNLIDTPGHPDFIAEVERALGVLDGAVLVVSAVEGVQAQTRILLRTLRRLGIPTLVFVNKIDRGGAQYARTLDQITRRLAPAAPAMGRVEAIGTRGARALPHGPGDAAFRRRLTEVLAEQDDELLAAYVSDAAVPYERLLAALAAQTRECLVHPVFFGSAVTGTGLPQLMDGIRTLLPSATEGDGELSGNVFKVERGGAGEKIAYVRMFSGSLRVRDRVPVGRDGAAHEGKVTAVEVFHEGAGERRSSVRSGEIAKVWGLGEVRIGDWVGAARKDSADQHFAPPTLETLVVPGAGTDRGALHLALAQLAEQDPLIGLRQDEVRGEVHLSLYGEVQKEVIQTTLAEEFGLDVAFRETTTICVERPLGVGYGYEKDLLPFLGTVGLRVEPAPPGSGVSFGLEVELGSMPYAFFKAVEETVYETLGQGLLGWRVLDCKVTMTHCGYWPRQSHSHATFDKSMSSTAGDFRLVTPLVLMDALREAGTRAEEPVHHFRLDLPADTLGPVLPLLGRLRAVPRPPDIRGAACTLEGEIPAASLHQLGQLLPGLTRGEGVVESAFAGYRPAAGEPPARTRTDHNPLNRKEYLLTVTRLR